MKVSNRIVVMIAVCAVLVLGLIGVATDDCTAGEKVYRMKIQSMYPRGDLSMETLKVFAESAEKYSNGRIKLKIYAEPEIVPGDQLFEATKQGVVDMLQGYGGILGGIIPIGYVEFALPLAFRIPEADTFKAKAEVIRDFYMNTGYMELLRSEYAKHGMYLLDVHTYGPVPFVLSTKSVRTCADLQGMKIKADGGNLAYHNGVGMQSVQISPTEAYMALKLGTVDAAEWDVSAVTGMKWHEVAPYWVKGMESDHVLGHILVSKSKWDSLPADLQAAMHKAAEDYWYADVDAYEADMETVQKLVEEGIVKESILDEACQQKYAEVAHQMWDELAKQDEASAKAIKMIKEWRGVK